MVLDYSGSARIKDRVALHGGCDVGCLTILQDNTRPEEHILGFHNGHDSWFVWYSSTCPNWVKRHPNGTFIVRRERLR